MFCHFVSTYISHLWFFTQEKAKKEAENDWVNCREDVLSSHKRCHLMWPYALWEIDFPWPNGVFLPLSPHRLPDRAVFHAGQQPDVSGPTQWDHLHQNPLLRHHRPGLGTPLRAVPRPAAPLQAGVHPQHSHRSLSRSDEQDVTI